MRIRGPQDEAEVNPAQCIPFQLLGPCPTHDAQSVWRGVQKVPDQAAILNIFFINQCILLHSIEVISYCVSDPPFKARRG